MTKAEKINQLLAGIMCEYNQQNVVNEQLKPIRQSYYPEAFKKHSETIYDRLESIYQDICDFSNDLDINSGCSIQLNNTILRNLKEEEE